ncbi:MAG TPA: hypothetical protein V6C97_31915 [Oculatellaceae cyanobacterium]
MPLCGVLACCCDRAVVTPPGAGVAACLLVCVCVCVFGAVVAGM